MTPAMGETMEARRDDLFRARFVRPYLRAVDDSTDTGLGTLFGHAARFDEWTEINSPWEGHFLERIVPGAFRKTLRERGSRVKVLLNHGMDPQVGDKPLGVPSVLHEDDEGLYHETPLLDTTYNRDIAELVRAGAIDGQSIRFTVMDEEWVDRPQRSEVNPQGLPERTIRAVRLYELGPVTFPAYEATTVGVRSAAAYEAWAAVRGIMPATGFAIATNTNTNSSETGDAISQLATGETAIAPTERRVPSDVRVARLAKLETMQHDYDERAARAAGRAARRDPGTGEPRR